MSLMDFALTSLVFSVSIVMLAAGWAVVAITLDMKKK